MKQWVGVTVALLALLATAGVTQAAGTQAGATRVQKVTLYKIGDRVTADVVVAHPDVRAAKPSRRARNRGTVAVTLRSADGAVLTRDRASASLPVAVPRARSVVQTYRFTLPAAAADRVTEAGSVQVQTIAESRLDVDGGGPDTATTDRDTDTADVAVQVLDADPPKPQYHELWFATGVACDIEGDDCGTYFDNRSDPAFHNESGRVKIENRAGGGKTITVRGVGDRFLQGWVSGLNSERFEITTGTVVPWGIGRVSSAGRADGTAGKVGGPLFLDIEKSGPFGAHDWHAYGYVMVS